MTALVLLFLWCALSVPASVVFGRAIAGRRDRCVVLPLASPLSEPTTSSDATAS